MKLSFQLKGEFGPVRTIVVKGSLNSHKIIYAHKQACACTHARAYARMLLCVNLKIVHLLFSCTAPHVWSPMQALCGGAEGQEGGPAHTSLHPLLQDLLLSVLFTTQVLLQAVLRGRPRFGPDHVWDVVEALVSLFCLVVGVGAILRSPPPATTLPPPPAYQLHSLGKMMGNKNDRKICFSPSFSPTSFLHFLHVQSCCQIKLNFTHKKDGCMNK